MPLHHIDLDKPRELFAGLLNKCLGVIVIIRDAAEHEERALEQATTTVHDASARGTAQKASSENRSVVPNIAPSAAISTYIICYYDQDSSYGNKWYAIAEQKADEQEHKHVQPTSQFWQGNHMPFQCEIKSNDSIFVCDKIWM